MCDKHVQRCSQQVSRRQCFIGVASGLSAGCLGGLIYLLYTIIIRHTVTSGGSSIDTGSGTNPTVQSVQLDQNLSGHHLKIRRNLYVGVLSTQLHVSSRAAACLDTWASHPGLDTVQVFAQLGPESPSTIRVTNITDVDGSDRFHNQKTLYMLEHMCLHHVDEYDWFIRSVDDVYIRVDRLHTFLSTLDKSQLIYLGHPSSLKRRSSVGDGNFCSGGPGIILSRPALQAFCPHVQTCLHHYDVTTPPDENLGRCLRDYVGLSCPNIKSLRRLFYDSAPRNTIELFEEMTAHNDAISMHPLKLPALMHAVHQYYTNRNLMQVSQHLGRQERDRDRIQSLVSSTSKAHIPLQTFHPAVFSSPSKLYDGSTCRPVIHTRGAVHEEINQVIRLSNVSCRLGELLDCPYLVDGHMEKSSSLTHYDTSLSCTNIYNTSENILVRVRLNKMAKDPQIKRVKIRKLPSQFVLLLLSNYNDSGLLPFLVRWQNLVRFHPLQENVVKVFLQGSNQYSESSAHLTGLPLEDLTSWNHGSQMKLQIHGNFTKGLNIKTIQQIARTNLEPKYLESVFIITYPNLLVDYEFLQKCLFMVRKGKRMYAPFPEQNVMFSHSQSGSHPHWMRTFTDSVWSNGSRPICVHAQDFLNHKRRRRTKSGPYRQKQIKIISTLDRTVKQVTLLYQGTV